jgi:hypothetical protein
VSRRRWSRRSTQARLTSNRPATSLADIPRSHAPTTRSHEEPEFEDHADG